MLAAAAVLADIATGKTQGAEICFLIALIVAGIVAVIRLTSKALDGALMAAAVALIALGFLLL